MNNKKAIRSWLLIGFASLWVAACSVPELVRSPVSSDGSLDLTHWNFEQNGAVHLNGQWIFNWRQLLTPNQVQKLNQVPVLAPVPALWRNYENNISNEGFATFSLTLLLPETDQTYGLFIQGVGSAYRLYVDGVELASNGAVGISYETTTPEKKPTTVFFQSRGQPTQLVMQIANFNHRKGGFRNELVLDLAVNVHHDQMRASLLQAACISILLAFSLYYFFMFYHRTEDHYALYFSILCLLVATRVSLVSDNVMLPFNLDLGWVFALKLEYLTLYFAIPIFTSMMRSLYPNEVHRYFLVGAYTLALGFSMATLLTTTLTASYSIFYYQIIVLLEMVYCFYFLTRIFLNKREGRYYLAVSTCIGGAGLVLEILYFRGLVDIDNFGSYGMLGFIFVQALFLAARLSKSYQRVEELSGQLEVNINELRLSEQKYRTIFEDSQDMIFVASMSGMLENVSPASIKLVGYTPDEILNIGDLNLLGTEADRSRFGELMTVDGVVEDFDVSVKHKDGHTVRVLVNATARFGENGVMDGFQGYARDITDKVQAQEQRERAERLEIIATTDPLTGAYTRRYFYDASLREIARAGRRQSPLSLVILDIDLFKKINDNFGHLAGDKVLIELASLCQRNLRATDVFTRFGGEEFIVLMPDTSLELAEQKTETLRKLVEKAPLANFNGHKIKVTFSAGLSAWCEGQVIDNVIELADKALYQAKQAGRNRTLIWQEAEPDN